MKSNEHWTDRLSEYVDGDLGPEERTGLEAHLERCGECRATLEELRSIVADAGTLPPLPPKRDLWPGIEARLGSRAGDRVEDGGEIGVIPLARRRRVAMTIPQAIAAAVALVLFSAGGVWMTVVGSPGPSPATNTGAAPAMALHASFTATYEDAITELEAEYQRRRTELDPETIRVVERNLDIIDGAIEEARRALESDPSSGFLSSHLAEAMRRKMELLRRAATIETTEI